MGLDSVELVVEIEGSFDVRIPDKAAAEMRTPGDIFDFIQDTGFKALPKGPCLSHAVFNRLRRAVMAEFQLERWDVKPTGKIGKVIPQFRIRSRRKSLFKRLMLRRPSPMIWGLHWFRRDFGTFGDLAKEVLAWNYASLSEEVGAWNSNEAWNCLRLIIAAQLGAKIDAVTRTSNFVTDLGLS